MDNQENFLTTLSPTELNTYQELFSFFDKEDSGIIPISSVPMYIRGLGHCPTQAEMGKILEGFGSPKKTEVTFHELVKFIASRPKQQLIQDQLLDAFYSIQASITSSAEAGKTEAMPINLLKKLLTESGEPFNESQLQLFTQLVNGKDLKFCESEFYYKKFCKILAYSDMEN